MLLISGEFIGQLNWDGKKLLIFLLLSRIIIYFVGNNVISFANQWDSPHYLYLAENWYTNIGDQANFIVFLPLYPFFIKVFSLGFFDYKIVSLFLSNLFFILGGLIFYKLLRLDYSEKFSVFVLVLLSVFPTSFFFSSTYPESLYLFLFSLSFYLVRKNYLTMSFATTSLLTLTRPFGILIWLPLLIESLKKNKLSKILPIISFFCIFSILIYLLINYLVYGNFFAFQKILQNNWVKSFSFPWKGILNSWKIALGGRSWDEYKIFVGWAEALASTIAWLFIPLSFIKKFRIRTSYIIYYLMGVMMMTSTGFILSSPRYLLSLPPFFIILAKILKSKFLKIIWLMVSVTLFLLLSSNFSKGLWSL